MKTPLRNGLFVRRYLSNLILVFLSIIFRRRKTISEIPPFPKKILICNIAHLGDVVISTVVLPVIKKQFPSCEIAFLTSRASSIVLKKHPLIDRIYKFDHWYLRRDCGKCKAVLQHWRGRRQLLRQLRDVRYDIAIDLYFYYPNAIPILARSRIPVCIGYTTGGFSLLLTHPVKWNFFDSYVGSSHLHLLTIAGIDISGQSPLPSYYYKREKKEYIVIHMGSLEPLKEWEPNKWIELILRLKTLGRAIVLTGKGAREGDLCKYVADRTFSKDLSNQLDWLQFVTTVQEACLLISIDSVAVHIAAAALTPTVGLFTGINSSSMWMPPSPFYIGLMKKVPCEPCFNKKGCLKMSCIKEIEVTEVYDSALKLMYSRQLSNNP